MKFRTDINGLRAYAVLAVIIFHFNKQWLSGGFAGVDVFFVISGYLMTSIIFRGIENNNFSIWKFYAARVKRIIPALLILIVILIIFGYLFLGSGSYKILSKHSISSLLFISNIIYWRESGYFDTNAIEKYLLHTWSLSVEWQFYILYPLGILILSKICKLENVKKILIAGTILSLAFAIYSSQRWAVAAYFLLPTRMWEMLLGGIAFLYPFELRKQYDKYILELSGLGLIIVSFFIITENTIWPGYAALIPTLGTFILIQANNYKSIFTNNIICQKLGLWSYSLYLWHWSLLAIYNYFNYKVKFWPFLFVTLACGITSYYLIEKRKWSVWLVLFATIIILGASYSIYKTNGIAFRNTDKLNLTPQEYKNLYEGHMRHSNNVDITYFNSTQDDFEYILLGNSHARHFFSYIDKNNIKLAEVTLDGCFSTKNFYTTYDKDRCSQIYDLTSQFIKNNPEKKIILSYALPSQAIDRASGTIKANFIDSHLDQELDILFNEIINSNSEMFLIGDTQGSNQIMYSCLSQQSLIGIKYFNPTTCEHTNPLYEHKNNQHLETYVKNKNSEKIHYIDPTPALCNNESCTVLTNDNNPIYTDTNHLSIYGADIVGKYIFDEINKIENKKSLHNSQ